MRCCRCRLTLLLQTALVLLTIYYFLFSGLQDWKQESMEVITTTTTDMTTKTEDWDEVVAKMGEQLVVKRSRNKNPRILEYPSL